MFSKHSMGGTGSSKLNTDLEKSLEGLTDEEIRGRLDLWWAQASSKKKKLTIVLVGKTGTGKSSLVNSLIGCKEAKVGLGLTPQTKGVFIHSTDRNGVKVKILDTRGLQDPDCDDMAILNDIHKKTEQDGFDLLLFCIPMNGNRIDASDTECIGKVKEVFGQGVFKNSVIALTFANHLIKPEEWKKTEVDYFDHRMKQWKKAIGKYISNVAIVPVGYTEPSLPGISDWYTVFWMTCFDRMKVQSKPSLLKVSLDRFKCKKDVKAPGAGKPTERPIVLDEENLSTELESVLGLDAKALAGGVGGAGAVGVAMGIVVSLIGAAPMGVAAGVGVGGVGGGAFAYFLASSILQYMRETYPKDDS